MVILQTDVQVKIAAIIIAAQHMKEKSHKNIFKTALQWKTRTPES
jgi:hypothetical protein